MKNKVWLPILIVVIAMATPLSSYTQTLAGGNGHSISLCNDSTLNAWGFNLSGQVGNGTNSNCYSPVVVSGLAGITKIAASYEHSLAIKEDGTIWGWGNNFQNQLGTGNNTSANEPVQAASGISDAIAIAAGWAQSYAVTSDGTAWGWGDNAVGQLGNGTLDNSNVPAQVSNLTGIVAISAGSYHCLALKDDSTVFAWGTNYSGELGTGDNNAMTLPAQMVGLTEVVAISAGSYSHSLALKSDGTVWACGLNSSGQLGLGTLANVNTATQIPSLSDIISIAGANGHSLAVRNDGTVWAWGWNYYGQLGTGDNLDSNVPLQVVGLSDIVEVVGGRNHSMARKNDGTIWVWGENSVGQLANNQVANSSIPLQVEGLCIEIIAVPENTMPAAITIFPNPATSQFVIAGTMAKGEVTIFDATGIVIFSQRTSQDQTTVNATTLPAGFYVIHYSDGITNRDMKLLKL